MAKQFNVYFPSSNIHVWVFLDDYNQTFQDDMSNSTSYFVDKTDQPQLNMACCEIHQTGIAYYTVRFFRANDEYEVANRDYFTVEKRYMLASYG